CSRPNVMIYEPPHDPTVVSESMVVDLTLCVESLPDKVFRRLVSLSVTTAVQVDEKAFV
ncbi:hypothetical protein A2U01_0079091, partial [Trifolium medium]|nr:hypothetical protein [Trifolium medium]